MVELAQALLRIQPAPARHPHAQRPRAPAGSWLQQHHYRPQTLVATKTCLPIPSSGGVKIYRFFKNFKMISFSAFSPKLALGAAAPLAAISLSPGSAQAIVVNVGGVQYDVTTFNGSYNDNTSKFALPPAPGVMPWWGSQSLAQQFAAALGGNLGLPNNDFIDIGLSSVAPSSWWSSCNLFQ
jgi:hypothetical protein